MNVVFLSPNYPPEMQQFVRGLAEVGATVLGVGDSPVQGLAPIVSKSLTDYLQVPSIMDEADVIARVEAWLRGRSIDRVETNWEPLTLTAAAMRERWGVPGMTRDAVLGFRDKVLMRERLAAAGIRVPKSFRVRNKREAWAAAEQCGWPVIFKPIAGAGSADTWRSDNPREFERALAMTQHIEEASVEEFITGDEYTYETISVDAEPVVEGCTRYYPNVLEARKNEWISPIIFSIRDLQRPDLQGNRPAWHSGGCDESIEVGERRGEVLWDAALSDELPSFFALRSAALRSAVGRGEPRPQERRHPRCLKHSPSSDHDGRIQGRCGRPVKARVV